MHNENLPGIACSPDAHGHCGVCADEGVVARVLSVHGETKTATAVVAGEEVSVALDLIDAVGAGETILVHLGFAIARVREPLSDR